MEIEQLKKELSGVIDHAKAELGKLRSTRVDPEIIYGITVEAYGGKNPIRNVANVSVVDAKTLIVQPWDKGLVEQVYKDLTNSDIGASFVMEGDKVRVIFPDLTKERREEMVKLMNKQVEDFRASIRGVRQKYMQEIDESLQEGLSEDMAYRLRDEGEKIVKKFNEQLEEMRDNKEKELMTV